MFIIEQILKGELEPGGNEWITGTKRVTYQEPRWGYHWARDGKRMGLVLGGFQKAGLGALKSEGNSGIGQLCNLRLGGRKSETGLELLFENRAGRR